ncbi:MAG: hypothetical protein ACFFA0_15855 [Promethearchaeota archaeon]
MAVTKLSHDTDIIPLDDSAKIQFICPICKSEKVMEFPKSVIAKAKGLTTMSVAKGLVCEHQFQAFVDKNYMVRGYQRVDFEFEKIENQEKNLKYRTANVDDKELFENLILEGDYLEYKPYQKRKDNKREKQNNKNTLKDRKLTLKEIYNEFWEFIDEDNKLFQGFIKNDTRRK